MDKNSLPITDLKPYSRFFWWGSILLGFLFLPILFLGKQALTSKLWQLLEAELWQALKLSLQTSLISCAIVVIFGTPLAFYFSIHREKKLIKHLQLISDLPLTLPPAVAGLSLLLIFSPTSYSGRILSALGLNIAFSAKAVIIAQIFVVSPFFIRACRLGFDQLDKRILDAATVDGASEWQRFFYIALPTAKASIFSGITLCGLRAIGEFGATAIFAGNLPGSSQTVSLFIYDSLATNWQLGVALSFLVMVICWAGLLLMTKLVEQSQYSTINSKSR